MAASGDRGPAGRRPAGPRRGGRRGARAVAGAVRARWAVDARFGGKGQAVRLLQEWVRTVGAGAGALRGVELRGGYVGAPESRLELELEFGSLAEVERFWAAVDPDRHRDWCQRAGPFLVDSSPRWEVYTQYPVDAEPAAAPTLELADALPAVEPTAEVMQELLAASRPPPEGPSGEVPDVFVDEDTGLATLNGEDELPPNVVLDWKGDPMKINPGDNLPGF